jgi:hypothetical protein
LSQPLAYFAAISAFLASVAAEALDATGRVDQLLLAGKERVAGRADFEHDIALVRGARGEVVAARTAHVGFVVIGVNPSLGHVVESFQLTRRRTVRLRVL